MERSITVSGTPRRFRSENISIIGVVRAIKNSEHMPPNVLAMRSRARLAPSLHILSPKRLTAKIRSPVPVINATTMALIRAKDRGMSKSAQ